MYLSFCQNVTEGKTAFIGGKEICIHRWEGLSAQAIDLIENCTGKNLHEK